MERELPTTIEEYISTCAPEVQPILRQLRQTIAKAAPQATEKISWGMATFSYYGNLVHFSAGKNHVGFHPDPSAIDAFREELGDYRCSKGTIQFPYEKPLPLDLIARMVSFRTAEQESFALDKQSKNQTGTQTEKKLRPRHPMPDDVAQALREDGLTEAYDARPPYQRNDYISWIAQAKRPETRQKRLRQMLDELRAGGVYMGRSYSAKK